MADQRDPGPAKRLGIPEYVSRRDVLKGVAGVAGLAAVPAFLAACTGGGGSSTAPSVAASIAASVAPPPSVGSSTGPGPSTGGLTGELKLGSNYSAPPEELKAMQDVAAGFQTASGVTVHLNTVDHNTFQDQLTNYLNGTPDDAFSWFSGNRMRFFADQKLTVPIDDVWASVGSNFSEGFHQSVIGNDGKIYGVPVDYYPWALFYRKSILADNKIDPPATWDAFKAACEKLKGVGMTPLAFGDKDGWPAMGTFDIINLRLNGYQFHVDLLSGKE